METIPSLLPGDEPLTLTPEERGLMQKHVDRSKIITKKMIDAVVKDGGEIIQVAEDRNCFYEALLAQGIRFLWKT